jgi:hypothetical protein
MGAQVFNKHQPLAVSAIKQPRLHAAVMALV